MNIYGISSGFVQICENFLGTDKKVDPKEIFKRLSLEIGGDGESIKKSDLDSYIKKAEAGSVDVDKNKLNSLKNIQNKFSEISTDDDSITFDEMNSFSGLLFATVTSDVIAVIEESESKKSREDAIYDYLMDDLGLSSKDDIKESDLTEYLNNIIAGTSSEDDSDSELVGTLINLIESYSSMSTMELSV